jgi:hypothetical protein
MTSATSAGMKSAERRETHQLHSEQKVILMFDQELEHRLAQRMLGRSHLVFGVRDDSGLEDDREVCVAQERRWDHQLTASD